MNKFASIVALGAVVALGGCSFHPIEALQTLFGKVGASVSSSQLYTLENAYGIAQSAAVGYSHLPRCSVTAPPCASGAVIKELAKRDLEIRAVLDKVEPLVRTGQLGNSTYISLIGQAQDLIGQFQQIESLNGVK